MAAVSIRNLGIAFGAQQILQGLNLEVRDGEFLVLLGPSGCGKSTLLHGVAGLVDVAEGSVTIGGEDVTDLDPSRRHIGMVFQSYALYPTMTVEKNLSFGLRVSGLPRAEIARRVDQVARMLQLSPLLGRKPAALSGGQRQRVAIGRALVRDARVFLFDEPLSNLDAQLRTELRRELKLLHQKLGATMIYVTHDQVEAMTLADRIVVMCAGRIQQVGAPAEVYSKPANLFVAGFLGAPAMNFIHGQLQLDNGARTFVAEGLRLDLSHYVFSASPAERQPVVLGLRPEQLRINADGAFQGQVELVEPMGNHQVVWLRCGGHGLSVLRHDTRPLAVGDTLRFNIHNDKLSLFDRDRETRL